MIVNLPKHRRRDTCRYVFPVHAKVVTAEMEVLDGRETLSRTCVKLREGERRRRKVPEGADDPPRRTPGRLTPAASQFSRCARRGLVLDCSLSTLTIAHLPDAPAFSGSSSNFACLRVRVNLSI